MNLGLPLNLAVTNLIESFFVKIREGYEKDIVTFQTIDAYFDTFSELGKATGMKRKELWRILNSNSPSWAYWF